MFVSCLWHVLWPQLEDIVVDGKGSFPRWFWVKMACTGVAKELSATLLRRSHTGFKMQPSGTPLHGFWRNCVALSRL